MSESPLFDLEASFAAALGELGVAWTATAVPEPRLLVANDALALELGVDPEALRSPAGVAVLAGNATPTGAAPIAMAYAGHQFGGFSPSLGDGRALLLGELVDARGRRHDVHLKGSGATPFARGGDGRAAVGPMLREYLISEAMHALGIPTTRGLAVVATGEWVLRESPLPGAVFTRVASSHLRVGTFQYAVRKGGPELVMRLAEHAIERHGLPVDEGSRRLLSFLEAVCERQAELIARWMLVGFVHGVMNTDNTTISGETIDYGPCAFMDRHDPKTVFSSIDHGGRYAYGNQPAVAQWNLARLAEALLPAMGSDPEAELPAVIEVLEAFPERFRHHWRAGMADKLGLRDARAQLELIEELPALLESRRIDHSSSFRALADLLRGDPAPWRALCPEPESWSERWRAATVTSGRAPSEVAECMDRVNPRYVPRNHLVEEALAAATRDDLAPFEALLAAVTRPFEERPGLEPFAEPAPVEFNRDYRTFCGT